MIIAIILTFLFSFVLGAIWGLLEGLKAPREQVKEVLNNILPQKREFSVLPSNREKEALKLEREGVPSIREVLKDD